MLLPSLARLNALSLSTEVKRARDEAPESREAAIRDLVLYGQDNVQTRPVEDSDLATLYTNNTEDEWVFALVCYTKWWDSTINRYLRDLGTDPVSTTPFDYHNLSTGLEKLQFGLLMFMNHRVFYSTFVDEEFALDDFEFAIQAVRANCTFEWEIDPAFRRGFGSWEIAPEETEEQTDAIEQTTRVVTAGLNRLFESLKNEEDAAIAIYNNVVYNMIDGLNSLWRPWVFYYERAGVLKQLTESEKRRKLEASSSTGGGPSPPEATPSGPSGPSGPQPMDVEPRPRARPPKQKYPENNRRIFDSIPEDLRYCVQTGAVLWAGFDLSGGVNLDLDSLGASLRSATLNWKVAQDFSGDDSVFALLLDDDVPVISVLDVLSERARGFMCFSGECEVLLSHGCRYTMVVEKLDSAEGIEVIKDNWPYYYNTLKKKQPWRTMLSPPPWGVNRVGIIRVQGPTLEYKQRNLYQRFGSPDPVYRPPYSPP